MNNLYFLFTMRFYIGNTDWGWYNFLSNLLPEEVNFWQPGGNIKFKILGSGAPFLFRLKSPINKIAGVGFFSSQTFLPIAMAWDIFHDENGCDSFESLRQMIIQYRKDRENKNPTIGCIILTNPIFFKEEDWINVPTDWNKNIVQGKSYDTSSSEGEFIWNKIESLLAKYLGDSREGVKSQLILEDSTSERYSNTILKKVRLGQGAFRVLITDTYQRKCTITGEKTLPVLEAAHIKPYALSGPHFISNGLLLRSDLHKLFDSGYITISKEYKVEVSGRIKEEFENGREYYQYHGKTLNYLPNRPLDKPNPIYIEWHNNSFKG